MLVILDGWGETQDPEISAVAKAKTPCFDNLMQTYKSASLRTDGKNVGLPEGQMGNSEVGHMNLGAGRIVYQDLAKINKAVESNSLKDEPSLKQAFDYAKKNDKAVHFTGLLSDGGVHSHIDHLKGLLSAAEQSGVSQKYVHAFTDGRDVDPKSGKGFVEELEPELKKHKAELASVVGRYYAMDRDKRWERTAEAYNLLVRGEGKQTQNASDAIQESYDEKVTDEFVKPIVLTDNNNNPVAKIDEQDVVIFFNFRTDRGRQLTQALSQENFPEQEMTKMPLYFVTMTNYDERFQNINVVFRKKNLQATLGETLEYMGKSQIRAAETEKYPHVTFFFSGGREQPFKDENRILEHSPKVATYDLQPEMSAPALTEKLVKKIKENNTDFFCINFANPDMVGHTGDFDAAVKAVETVDQSLQAILDAAGENYSSIVLADHGNCEKMQNKDGSANTAHTVNPVPVILVDEEKRDLNSGILGSIAPTILELMELDQPELMTQKSLLK